jgi:DNA-binding transcriptional MerR regulator
MVNLWRASGAVTMADMTDSVTEERAPRYTVTAVARRLGVAPATLRTWDRRYGLGPGDHQAGTRRKYTPRDLAVLELMRRLTLDGVAPAEAARLALAARAADQDGVGSAWPDWAGDPAGPDGAADGDDQADQAEPERQAVLARDGGAGAGGPRRGRAGGSGGRVLALPGAGAAARGLARAAMALDAREVSRIVRRALEADGVVATWEALLRPVLVAAGRRWAATGEGIDVEHVLAECTIGALRHAAGRGGTRDATRDGMRPAVLACGENEQHSLPLYAVAAGLAERRLPSLVLGAALPSSALHAAVARTGPASLFVWSQRTTTADPWPISTLPATRPATLVVVGGLGWQGVPVPRRVEYAGNLRQALELLGRGR